MASPWYRGKTNSAYLVEVVVGAAGDGVEEHEVLKVGDLPPLPLLGHV